MAAVFHEQPASDSGVHIWSALHGANQSARYRAQYCRSLWPMKSGGSRSFARSYSDVYEPSLSFQRV